MFGWFHARVHESVAVAALVAASAALHAAWILNLVWYRLSEVKTLWTLYLFVACVYAILFVFTLAWCRGRDCSTLRDRAAHSFLVAIVFFVAMTLPVVFGFSL